MVLANVLYMNLDIWFYILWLKCECECEFKLRQAMFLLCFIGTNFVIYFEDDHAGSESPHRMNEMYFVEQIMR